MMMLTDPEHIQAHRIGQSDLLQQLRDPLHRTHTTTGRHVRERESSDLHLRHLSEHHHLPVRTDQLTHIFHLDVAGAVLGSGLVRRRGIIAAERGCHK